jgi:UDP-2,3-diacylglucosamine pyrophosphatase LpxH
LKRKYKTIVVSDIHLGIKASKAKEVIKFLKHNSCETLILNGDIIDGWQLLKSGKWRKKHTRFFKLILNYVSRKKSKVVYLRGNHDDFLDEILPFELGNFSIQKYFVHESGDKKYFVVHGDLFDTVTNKFKWIAKLGDVGYTFLLWLNRHYNNYREKKGLPYYSLSQVVKNKVKSAVSFITDFENELAGVAKARKCDGIICGHIHQPADRMIDGIHYLNSGDWVETLSALVEDYEGKWSIVYYSDWLKEYNESKNATGDFKNVDISSVLPDGVSENELVRRYE